jgi:alkaline phosphatase D
VIWTRVTPNTPTGPVPVEWRVSDDSGMRRIVRYGVTYTDATWDYTVKIDVARLSPGTTYYYQFSLGSEMSLAGRTRTLPWGSVDRLRFAVSCSNYPYGFFNSYRAVAARADLDLVMHSSARQVRRFVPPGQCAPNGFGGEQAGQWDSQHAQQRDAIPGVMN